MKPGRNWYYRYEPTHECCLLGVPNAHGERLRFRVLVRIGNPGNHEYSAPRKGSLSKTSVLITSYGAHYSAATGWPFGDHCGLSLDLTTLKPLN